MNQPIFKKVYDVRPPVSGFARIAPPLPGGKRGNSCKAALIESHLNTKEIQILQGSISRLYWSGQGDTWPMFELTTDAGQTSQWERQGDESLYRIGQKALVYYYIDRLTEDEVAKRVSEGWSADYAREARTKVVEIHLEC